jgi:hypothetical protein
LIYAIWFRLKIVASSLIGPGTAATTGSPVFANAAFTFEVREVSEFRKEG